MQFVGSEEPMSGLKVPWGHSVQLPWPAIAAKVPLGQSEQAPVPLTKDPAGQAAVHIAWPAGL